MYGKGEKQILERASQHFVGRDPKEIQEVLCLTLEGHLRAITGQLTVKQIYQDREAFAHQVRETAMPDLGKMGIQIVSFVVQDIRDDVDYLSSIFDRVIVQATLFFWFVKSYSPSGTSSAWQSTQSFLFWA